ncbi:hypothetical protein C4553_01340 [Candidatus Parcubacteria bacterium]|nr:MAG: hypothetical protein C4553_01340 [Candidatus Parcubacteria bacterium]
MLIKLKSETGELVPLSSPVKELLGVNDGVVRLRFTNGRTAGVRVEHIAEVHGPARQEVSVLEDLPGVRFVPTD